MAYPVRSTKPPTEVTKPASPASPGQKRLVRVCAAALIVGGLVVLLLLQRMPAPLRIVVGLTDIFAGLGLLVLARQR